jgi:O-antigen ligase
MANRASGLLRRNLAYFLIVLSLVGGAVAYALTIPQVSEVIAYRTELQDYDADRFATHDAALELGLNNPLGVGPGQSFLLLDYATHSLYLRVFSENGVIGFLSLAAFVSLTLVRSLLLSQRSQDRFQRAMFTLIAATILGTVLNSFAIDTLHWRHFWFLLALGWMPLWSGPINARRDAACRSGAPTVISSPIPSNVTSKL